MIWSPPCQNVKLTSYDLQNTIKNGHETMSIVTVTTMPEYITHPLEQDEEWT